MPNVPYLVESNILLSMLDFRFESPRRSLSQIPPEMSVKVKFQECGLFCSYREILCFDHRNYRLRPYLEIGSAAVLCHSFLITAHLLIKFSIRVIYFLYGDSTIPPTLYTLKMPKKRKAKKKPGRKESHPRNWPHFPMCVWCSFCSHDVQRRSCYIILITWS